MRKPFFFPSYWHFITRVHVITHKTAGLFHRLLQTVSLIAVFFNMNSSDMHERRFLQRLNIYHCKTVKLFQMYEWPEFMWTCLNARVCVCMYVCAWCMEGLLCCEFDLSETLSLRWTVGVWLFLLELFISHNHRKK